MEKLITSIQDFPVIIQGAMGSALFALLLYIGQKIATYCLDSFRANSKKTRVRQLKEQYIRLRALKSEDRAEAAYFASLLWLRASRHVVKAMIWLTLGLAFESAFGTLSVVGFMGAIYYLFFALNIVKPISYDGDLQKRITEILAEMRSLEAETSALSNQRHQNGSEL
jgi:cell division protein FtsB